MIAAGGTATVEGMALPVDLQPRVAARLPAIGSPFAVALVEGDAEQVRTAARASAALPGPIALVQAATSAACAAPHAYAIDGLVAEVSTSINTTTAGGNATLMAIA